MWGNIKCSCLFANNMQPKQPGVRLTRVKAQKTTADTHRMPSFERLFGKYRSLVKEDEVLIDPFARNCPWAHPYTNDLNPDTDAQDHMDAMQWLRVMEAVRLTQGLKIGMAILDPPFSDRQAGEIYGSPNLYASDSAKLTKIFNMAGNLVEPGGYIVKAGYNTNPFHPCFDLVEVKMVYHGGTCNDTVFSVWRKTNYTLWDWEHDLLAEPVVEDVEDEMQ